MPISQSIKIKHPLLDGFLPPAPLEWDGDLHPVCRGKLHLLSLLGVSNELTWNEGFLFLNSLLFWRRKCTLKFISQHCKNTEFLHSNLHGLVNKGDCKVTHGFNRDPQCTPVFPFKWWSFYFVVNTFKPHRICTEVQLNTSHRPSGHEINLKL